MRRIIASAGIILWVVLAGTAAAQSYPPPGIGTDTPTPGVGDTVHVQGTGCAPGEMVTLTVDGKPAGTTVADENGNYEVDIVAPDSTGPHDVQASCGDRVLGLQLSVGGVAAAPLARTGSSATLPMTRIGAGLLAAGGLLVVLARRRRAVHA